LTLFYVIDKLLPILALKFTVAKYYTPSGRCIQSTNYSNGGGLGSSDGRYKASKVAEKDKELFYTTNGREVKDGGGVAVDYKVDSPKSSALEVTLLRSNAIADFAADWSKKNDLTGNFAVDDALYRQFQDFVMKQNKDGDLKLDAIYSGPINELKKSLERSEYKGSTKELQQLQASIMRDMSKDFDKYKKDIKEDIETGILSRYLPESMLINRSIQTDKQVQGALKIMKNQKQFNKLLARTEETRQDDQKMLADASEAIGVVSSDEGGAKMKMKF
jgi:carboxyl-terminal processing protease